MNITETKSEISKAAKRSWRKHSDEFWARVIAGSSAVPIVGANSRTARTRRASKPITVRAD